MLPRKQYLEKLVRKKDNGRVKVITGLRRCGKSFLLFKIYRNYLLDHGVDQSQVIAIAWMFLRTQNTETRLSWISTSVTG